MIVEEGDSSSSGGSSGGSGKGSKSRFKLPNFANEELEIRVWEPEREEFV